nr:hypothetical protein [uncultured Flavobacterium sp.]
MKKKRLLIILVPIYIIAIIVLFIFLTIKDNEKEDKISKEYHKNKSIFLKGKVYDYIDKGRCTILYIDVDTISYKHLKSDYFIGIYDTIEKKATLLSGFYYPGLIDGKKIPKDSLPKVEINYKENEIIFLSDNYKDTVSMDIFYLEFDKIKNLKCYNCIEF